MGQKKPVVAKKDARKQSGAGFVEDTKAELRRVTWPTRKTVISASGIIIFIVTFSTLYVSGVDYVLSKLANTWLRLP